MWYFPAVCIQAMVGVPWEVLLFDVEQGQVEVLKHAEQTCNNYITKIILLSKWFEQGTRDRKSVV